MRLLTFCKRNFAFNLIINDNLFRYSYFELKPRYVVYS